MRMKTTLGVSVGDLGLYCTRALPTVPLVCQPEAAPQRSLAQLFLKSAMGRTLGRVLRLEWPKERNARRQEL
jgi:hypothetical protein